MDASLINPAAFTDPRMALANQLLQSGTEDTPVRSWTQELARALSGTTGAYLANKIQGEKTDTLSKFGDSMFGETANANQPSAALAPNLFQRVGNFLTGGPSGSNPDMSGSPSGIPSGMATPANPPVSGQPGPQTGQPSGMPSGKYPVSQPAGNVVAPTGGPAPPSANDPISQQTAYFKQMYDTGKAAKNQFGQTLMEQAQQGMMGIRQKQIESELAQRNEFAKQMVRQNPDGSISLIDGAGNIIGQKAAAENPALIARAAGISHAELGDKITAALAPKQFDLNTGTQTVQTPGGPRLMTNAQAATYAQTGQLPGSAAQPPAASGANAPSIAGASPQPPPGMLQDPKVKEAQIAEIKAANTSAALADQRMQGLGQLKAILANPNIVTGANGDQLQTIRATVLQGYKMLGKPPPESLVSGVGGAEALTAAANSLAIEVSKDEAGSVPRVSIFNAISKNKPGMETSQYGNLVRVLSMEKSAQREKDASNFINNYYQQTGNFNKQDAETAFQRQFPVSEYVSQIYPQGPEDRAKIPVGAMYIGPDGLPHTKTADPAAQPGTPAQ